MVYEKDGVYYINKGRRYFVVDIIIKPHTVVVRPTSASVAVLHDATLYTYSELKRKFGK